MAGLVYIIWSILAATFKSEGQLEAENAVLRHQLIVLRRQVRVRRTLLAYACSYNNLRTHRSLDKDAPRPRSVQQAGRITSRAILGGLHHQYARG
jgi:hypothetical protein